MSAANPKPMEKSIVSVLVIENAGGGVAIAMSRLHALYQCQPVLGIPTTAIDLVGI
jgi:hypothetical protein